MVMKPLIVPEMTFKDHSRSLAMVQLLGHISLRISGLQYPCVYLVSFLRYSASNNDVPLKYGLEVIQSHCKNRSIDYIRLLISLLLKLSCIGLLLCSRYLSFKNIITLKFSLRVTRPEFVHDLYIAEIYGLGASFLPLIVLQHIQSRKSYIGL